MNSKLFIVSTPIGNLKDISLRAIEVLKDCDLIICEDTRVTGNLLKHYEISKELVSLNAFNEKSKSDFVISKIMSNEKNCLVSDAGTPGFSDPGYHLIRKCVDNNIEIEVIPGPTAMASALSLSSFPLDSFLYEGFIPQKKGRQKKLKELAEEPRTVVLYESVYRIERLINELCEYMPERQVAVCREITKMFQEVWRGTPIQLKDELPSKTIKGEFVVVLAPIDFKL